jgi:hypothetical protein
MIARTVELWSEHYESSVVSCLCWGSVRARRVTDDWWTVNWKECGRILLSYGDIIGIYQEGLRNSQYSWCPGRDSNWILKNTSLERWNKCQKQILLKFLSCPNILVTSFSGSLNPRSSLWVKGCNLFGEPIPTVSCFCFCAFPLAQRALLRYESSFVFVDERQSVWCLS